MYGDWNRPELRGIVPRAARYMFECIDARAAALAEREAVPGDGGTDAGGDGGGGAGGGGGGDNGGGDGSNTGEGMPVEYVIKVSMLEIYNETVRDLLNPKGSNLRIRETDRQGVWVDGASEEFVTCVQVRAAGWLEPVVPACAA